MTFILSNPLKDKMEEESPFLEALAYHDERIRASLRPPSLMMGTSMEETHEAIRIMSRQGGRSEIVFDHLMQLLRAGVSGDQAGRAFRELLELPDEE